MISLAAFESIAAACGLTPSHLPAVWAAARHADAAVLRARALLVDAQHPSRAGCCALALGSIGRMESSDASDLDLAFIFDPAVTSRSRAEQGREACLEALRTGFDVPEKTFRRAVNAEDLLHNVGGQRDTNERLTYRALLLTESAWILDEDGASNLRRAIFDVYARGKITRGKNLTSLTNDLHRYWRTVCVDYRYKVEEQAKGWAIRSMKLRHTRKLWHLANVALQLWAARRADEAAPLDEAIFDRLRWPPLARLGACLSDMGLAELARPLYTCHDLYLARLSDVALRRRLDALVYETRRASPDYVELRENARRLDEACEAIISELWKVDRGHLIRFCLL